MPDYVVQDKKEGSPVRQPVPDDIAYLRQLVTDGTIVTTPPQDYDDSY
jgi:hypothetical protein